MLCNVTSISFFFHFIPLHNFAPSLHLPIKSIYSRHPRPALPLAGPHRFLKNSGLMQKGNQKHSHLQEHEQPQPQSLSIVPSSIISLPSSRDPPPHPQIQDLASPSPPHPPHTPDKSIMWLVVHFDPPTPHHLKLFETVKARAAFARASSHPALLSRAIQGLHSPGTQDLADREIEAAAWSVQEGM